jgi:hypothetical protein
METERIELRVAQFELQADLFAFELLERESLGPLNLSVCNGLLDGFTCAFTFLLRASIIMSTNLSSWLARPLGPVAPCLRHLLQTLGVLFR